MSTATGGVRRWGVSFVGVDACRRGWIACELPDEGEPIAHFLSHIGEIASVAPGAEVIGVDIPIGLVPTGRRRADDLVQGELGRRRSSLFHTPPRSVLEAPSHAEGTRLAVELTGFGISQQSYALRSKILEVDAWLASAGDGSGFRVVEVHPELSFTAIIGRPANASKKTWAGMAQRRAALEGEGIVLDGLSDTATARAGIDDVLDAAAAAWTARRVHLGSARCLPDPPEIGEHDRPIAIWA